MVSDGCGRSPRGCAVPHFGRPRSWSDAWRLNPESIDVDLTDAKARESRIAEEDTLLIPRGNTFFVSGEVRKPGTYPLEKNTAAFGGVTPAGGFTEQAVAEPSQAHSTGSHWGGADARP